MKTRYPTALLILAVSFTTLAQDKGESARRRDDLKKPLVISRQGSFFVGGESKPFSPTGGTSPIGGDITVDQMYVQYQVPPDAEARLPVVMVHGCCLSSKSFETTPDGRMGWDEYFVRRGRSVYLTDQSWRGRSGFDASAIIAARDGAIPPSQLPDVRISTHQNLWLHFRFGPTFRTPFEDTQFPIEAVDELYKQVIPNVYHGADNPTPKNLAALAVKLNGAVLIGHSQSGVFPQQAALIDPGSIKGIIALEPGGCSQLAASQMPTLAEIPTLVVFGDHIGDIRNLVGNWFQFFEECKGVVQQLKDAGGDAEFLHLPELGIKGNSHLLMQDRNNLDLADLLLDWIDKHVESKRIPPGTAR